MSDAGVIAGLSVVTFLIALAGVIVLLQYRCTRKGKSRKKNKRRKC